MPPLNLHPSPRISHPRSEAADVQALNISRWCKVLLFLQTRGPDLDPTGHSIRRGQPSPTWRPGDPKAAKPTARVSLRSGCSLSPGDATAAPTGRLGPCLNRCRAEAGEDAAPPPPVLPSPHSIPFHPLPTFTPPPGIFNAGW